MQEIKNVRCTLPWNGRSAHSYFENQVEVDSHSSTAASDKRGGADSANTTKTENKEAKTSPARDVVRMPDADRQDVLGDRILNLIDERLNGYEKVVRDALLEQFCGCQT